MKINFKHPKYILPIIVLPFIFIFNYLIMDFFPEEVGEQTNLVDKAEMNTSLPDPNLKKIGINSKMDNLKDAFKDQTDISAISEDIKEEEDINTSVEESLYSSKEAEELLKLRDSIKNLKQKRGIENDIYSGYKPKRIGSNDANYDKEINDLRRQKNALKNQEKNGLTEEEKFLREMVIMDSIINPEKYAKKEVLKDKTIEKPKPRPLLVKNNENIKSVYFNTISSSKEIKNIEGLVDEKIKVYQNSRVRIKLASDIDIDGVKISKHQYIYGIVTGFKAQRVEISISNIVVDNKIYNVDLDVYDLDGMRGLYVPSSKFKEFTQTLGADGINNSSNNIGASGDNRGFVIDLVDRLAQTTSKSVSKLIKKNKATLKYNTKIYLINNKTK